MREVSCAPPPEVREAECGERNTFGSRVIGWSGGTGSGSNTSSPAVMSPAIQSSDQQRVGFGGGAGKGARGRGGCGWTFLEAGDESVGVDDRAARDVDERRAGLEQRDLLGLSITIKVPD